VALDAVADRRAMNRTFYIGSFLIRVATHTQRSGGGGRQLHPRNILADPNFVTTGAAHRHGGVDCFAFCLVFVASDASGGISLRVERDRMRGSEGGPN